MFDDQTTNAAPPANLPAEPDDMFAGVDKITPSAPSAPNALQAGVLKPKITSPAPSAPSIISPPFQGGGEGVVSTPPMYSVKEPVVGKIILIVVLLIILGGAGYFGYRVYASGFFAPKPIELTPPVNTPAPIVAPVNNIPEPVEVAPIIAPLPTTTVEATTDIASDEILFGEGVDSDKDGLDNVRERVIGTDMNKVDTDGDELSDGDEVIIWKTDPLKKDTDGDTYPDGHEVKNGYNPLGAGKLFNVPTTTK